MKGRVCIDCCDVKVIYLRNLWRVDGSEEGAVRNAMGWRGGPVHRALPPAARARPEHTVTRPLTENSIIPDPTVGIGPPVHPRSTERSDSHDEHVNVGAHEGRGA